MKILKIIFELLSKRSVKFLMGLIIFIVLFAIAAKEQYIDPEKFKTTIKLITAKDKKEFEFIFNENKKIEVLKEEKEKNKNVEEITKKEIKIDNYETEEKIKDSTNFFLILNRLNQVYEDRVKNKQIDYNRKVKDGDYLYVSIETDSLRNKENLVIGDSALNVFLPMYKKDNMYYDLLINKKVGYKLSITMDKVMTDIGDTKDLDEVLNAKLKQLDPNTTTTIKEELKNTLQTIVILDFIPKDVIKELNLEQFNNNNNN